MDKRLLVVSNSSPIMNLAIIGQLHLIQELFGEVMTSGYAGGHDVRLA